MRTERDEIVTNLEWVLKAHTQPITTEDVSPDNSEALPLINSELRKTLYAIKKTKAPGKDNLTRDLICLGGEVAISHVTKMLNEFIITRKIPKQWKEAKLVILHTQKGGQKRHKELSTNKSLITHV